MHMRVLMHNATLYLHYISMLVKAWCIL